MLDQALIVAGVTLIVLISPGPDMIIVIRNTFAGGRFAGYQTSLGILTGNLVHIAYSIIGIGLLISKSIVAFSILKYAAAAYLIYLGYSALRAKEIQLRARPDSTKPALQNWFLQGFVNNVLNPKGALYFLGIFTTVITPETSNRVTTVLALIIVSMCALFWLLFVRALSTQPIRNLLEKSQSTVQRILGAVLITLGIRVAAMSQ